MSNQTTDEVTDGTLCRENDPRWPFPCSCNACCRASAGQWISLMDRVSNGDMSLSEAQTIQHASDSGSGSP